MLSIRYSTSICMAMPSNGLYTEVSIGMALQISEYYQMFPIIHIIIQYIELKLLKV